MAGTTPVVAPHGGRTGAYSTNPIAFGGADRFRAEAGAFADIRYLSISNEHADAATERFPLNKTVKSVGRFVQRGDGNDLYIARHTNGGH